MAIAKPLSVLAALAALAAAGLMIFSCLNQNFVAVEFGTVDACNVEEQPIATVGVFQSTFDDSCLEGTAFENAYDSLGGKIESPTTEFFPLFPAQTGFGGLVEDVPEFTNCKEFYESAALTSAAVTTAIKSVVVPSAEENFALQYESLTTQINTVFGGIPLGLNGYLASQFAPGYNNTVQQLKLSALGVNGLLQVFYGFKNACATAAAGSPTDTSSDTLVIPTDCSAVCPGGSPLCSLADGVQFSVAGAAGVLKGQLETANFGAAANIVTQMGGSAAGISVPVVGQLNGILLLHVGGGLVDATTAALSDVSPFGGVLALEGERDENFSGVKAALVALNNAGLAQDPPVTNFVVPSALLSLCSETSVDACLSTTGALGVDVSSISLNDTATFPLCMVAGASEDFNTTSIADSTDCSFFDLLIALTETRDDFLEELVGAILGSDSGIVLGDLLDAVPLLRDPLQTCSEIALTLSECGSLITLGTFSAEDNAGFPSSWITGSYALCAGLGLQGYTNTCDSTPFPAGTFRAFVYAVDAEASLAVLGAGASGDETLIAAAKEAKTATAALNGLVNGVCFVAASPAAVDDLDTCLSVGLKGALALDEKPETLESLFAGLEGAVYEQVGLNDTLAGRIAECEDDEKDLEIFGQAQGMAAFATAAAGLVALLSVVNIVKTGPKLSLVAGLLALVAGGVFIGALLLVRTAPVYGQVSDDEVVEVPGTLYYKASFVQLYALVACMVAFVAGFLLLGTACASRGGSDEEADGKVATASY